MAGRDETTVAVIGGGICGLSAALALHKRGRRLRAPRGERPLRRVIRTETEDGFLLEAGPDSMLAQKPQGIELCRELGLGERLVPTNPEKRKVYVLHRRAAACASGRNAARGSHAGAADAAEPALLLARQAAHGPRSRAPRPRRARRRVDRVVPAPPLRAGGRRPPGRAAPRGIHAGDPERLSILATFPRLRELERTRGSLVRATRRGPRQRAGEAPPAAFYSLRCGLAELVTALVARLEPASLRTRAAVVEVKRRDQGFELRLEGGERFEAGGVVVAAPGPRIAPALEALVPDAARALRAIPFASTATVLLGFKNVDVRHPLDGYGLVVPASEGLRTKCLELRLDEASVPGAEGHVLLRAFLGGVRDPGALSLSDDEMIESVTREMTGVLGLGGQPVLRRVFRWPSATPQLEVGHLERMRGALSARSRRSPASS
jgi:oxygen-dependent protoporphyrinogen oxidase